MALNKNKLLLNYKKYLTKFRFKHSWSIPEGYDTGIQVYNCVTKTKVPLIVRDKNAATWYTCGPTVYDSSHMGHASCYVKLDIIQRILRNYFNINLVTVMNITDIDDKIIKKSLQSDLPVMDVAKRYEKDFWADMALLKITQPNIVLRVTENMSVIVKFIEKLVADNKAYKTGDNSIYFDLSQYGDYGKLQNIGEVASGNGKSQLKRGAGDFALWKGCKSGEPSWDSPWGPGRPGWHIECSALASHALGSNIDIHAGGIDLRFPHHENEETQSCTFHNNQQWVNYWLHTGHLHLKQSEKMSKSLKNTLAIDEVLQGGKVDVFRMACAMSHYRSNMEFTGELMDTASNVLKVYKNFFSATRDFSKGILKTSVNNDVLRVLLQESSGKIHQVLCNDFDTPGVLKILNEIVTTVNSMLNSSSLSLENSSELSCVTAISNLCAKVLDLFGVNVVGCSEVVLGKGEDFGEIMDILCQFRQDVRQVGICEKNQKVLRLCDEVRDNLGKSGVVVKDHGKISSWTK